MINLARSALRHRTVARAHAPKPAPDAPSAEQSAYEQFERRAVVQALARLPVRTREALVLRYYADLTLDQVAAAMSVRTGSAKSYCSRGLSELSALLKEP